MFPEDLVNEYTAMRSISDVIICARHVQNVFTHIYTLWLKCEHSPTITRMWTFHQCIYGFLCAGLIVGPYQIREVLRGIGTNEEGYYSGMAVDVISQFENKKNRQRLKKVGIALRISEKLHNKLAKKTENEAKNPDLVALSNGEYCNEADDFGRELLGHLVEAVPCDPDIDLPSFASHILYALCMTHLRLTLRNKYPYTLWRLSRDYNPGGYVGEIKVLCEKTEDEALLILDRGFTMKHWYNASKSENPQAYWHSKEMQDEILFRCRVVADSLIIEKKHNFSKPKRERGRVFINTIGFEKLCFFSILLNPITKP